MPISRVRPGPCPDTTREHMGDGLEGGLPRDFPAPRARSRSPSLAEVQKCGLGCLGVGESRTHCDSDGSRPL